MEDETKCKCRGELDEPVAIWKQIIQLKEENEILKRALRISLRHNIIIIQLKEQNKLPSEIRDEKLRLIEKYTKEAKRTIEKNNEMWAMAEEEYGADFVKEHRGN